MARLFDTFGSPPVPRNTRAIEIISERQLPGYVRSRIAYQVGEDDPISAYLLRPEDKKPPLPAVVAMHQTVDCGKNEVVGLEGNPDYAYGHELAQRGYVVLAPDYLMEGERL